MLQLIGMRFGPFSGTDQSLFFAIPSAEDDRAFRTPAALGQLAHSLSFSENSNHPANRIFGAIHPGVVMIAADHPLIRPLAAAKPRDDIVCGHHFEVELQLEMHGRFART